MIDPDESKYSKRPLLVALRKRADHSQQSLADAIGVRRATISDWETGKVTPEMPLSIYWRLSRELRCTIEELIAAFEGEEALKGMSNGSTSEPGERRFQSQSPEL